MHSLSRVAWITIGLLCSVPLMAQRMSSAKFAETYGTKDTVLVGIDAMDLIPGDSSWDYTLGEGLTRYSPSASGPVFSAGLHLPAGAQLVYLELDYYDGTNTNEALLNLAACDYLGQDCELLTVSGGCPDAPGYILCSGVEAAPGFSSAHADVTSLNIFGDPFHQRLVVETGGLMAGGTAAIGQVIYGYKLRVSPPPAAATFSDVPTNHPFFQFVEALAASGITAGCGGGRYCPDQPVTRGQMAAFLAKALGLHFP